MDAALPNPYIPPNPSQPHLSSYHHHIVSGLHQLGMCSLILLQHYHIAATHTSLPKEDGIGGHDNVSDRRDVNMHSDRSHLNAKSTKVTEYLLQALASLSPELVVTCERQCLTADTCSSFGATYCFLSLHILDHSLARVWDQG